MYNNSNTNILAWYPDQRYQQHRKSYAQGQVWPLIAKTQRLPPFQVYREHLAATPISYFAIISIETGIVYDMTSEIVAAGLNIQEFSPAGQTAYDLIVYPGLIDIVGTTFKDGMYEAILSDADGTGNTWYSERFYMKSYVDNLVKINYWHRTPFTIPIGHISYADPYYNFIYLPLPCEVNRPKYEEEEEVEDRDGFKFPIYMVSKKVFRIVGLLLPEYLSDALRLVWMHTDVTVEFDGIEYETDSFRIIFDDFEKTGHLVHVTIEFYTDTVVTKTGYIEEEDDGGDYDQTDYNDDHLIT